MIKIIAKYLFGLVVFAIICFSFALFIRPEPLPPDLADKGNLVVFIGMAMGGLATMMGIGIADLIYDLTHRKSASVSMETPMAPEHK